MFTFDIEALYPSIQVWPGVGGLCLLDVVERATRRFYSLEPDLVEFFCEVAAPCPVCTAHAVRRFLSRGHMGLVHWSSVCK